MTAAELYQMCPDFRSLVLQWVTDRRCPIGLVDFLLEHGMESQAEVAIPDVRNFRPFIQISSSESQWCFPVIGSCRQSSQSPASANS